MDHDPRIDPPRTDIQLNPTVASSLMRPVQHIRYFSAPPYRMEQTVAASSSGGLPTSSPGAFVSGASARSMTSTESAFVSGAAPSSKRAFTESAFTSGRSAHSPLAQLRIPGTQSWIRRRELLQSRHRTGFSKHCNATAKAHSNRSMLHEWWRRTADAQPRQVPRSPADRLPKMSGHQSRSHQPTSSGRDADPG
jgi:hypothetical protein